jgi:hypothetical protein
MIRARSTRACRFRARTRTLLQLLPLRLISYQHNHAGRCHHGSTMDPPTPNPRLPSTRSRAERQNRAQHIDNSDPLYQICCPVPASLRLLRPDFDLTDTLGATQRGQNSPTPPARATLAAVARRHCQVRVRCCRLGPWTRQRCAADVAAVGGANGLMHVGGERKIMTPQIGKQRDWHKRYLNIRSPARHADVQMGMARQHRVTTEPGATRAGPHKQSLATRRKRDFRLRRGGPYGSAPSSAGSPQSTERLVRKLYSSLDTFPIYG